jgi:hypothetical protein
MTKSFTKVFMPENFDPTSDRVAGYNVYYFVNKTEVLKDLNETVKKVTKLEILILEVL